MIEIITEEGKSKRVSIPEDLELELEKEKMVEEENKRLEYAHPLSFVLWRLLLGDFGFSEIKKLIINFHKDCNNIVVEIDENTIFTERKPIGRIQKIESSYVPNNITIVPPSQNPVTDYDILRLINKINPQKKVDTAIIASFFTNDAMALAAEKIGICHYTPLMKNDYGQIIRHMIACGSESRDNSKRLIDVASEIQDNTKKLRFVTEQLERWRCVANKFCIQETNLWEKIRQILLVKEIFLKYGPASKRGIDNPEDKKNLRTIHSDEISVHKQLNALLVSPEMHTIVYEMKKQAKLDYEKYFFKKKKFGFW